jgi:hypothetical protein
LVFYWKYGNLKRILAILSDLAFAVIPAQAGIQEFKRTCHLKTMQVPGFPLARE